MSGFSLTGAVVSLPLTAGISALESVLIRPSKRGFQPSSGNMIMPNCVLEESGRDELRITDHPVEYGSVISDNAYMMPCDLVVRYCWSNSNALSNAIGGLANDAISGNFSNFNSNTLSSLGNTIFSEDYCKSIYKQLLDLQAQRLPFTVYTGKRVYQNMLLAFVNQITDYKSEYSLMTVLRCRQIIIAYTVAAQIPPQSSQATPASTAQQQNAGSQQAAPPDNQSVLQRAFNTITGAK